VKYSFFFLLFCFVPYPLRIHNGGYKPFFFSPSVIGFVGGNKLFKHGCGIMIFHGFFEGFSARTPEL